MQVPCAFGPPPATGQLRAAPEDFRVEEQLGFAADGVGGHALVTVEKRESNTGWVAARLARHAGVPVRDIGFSGRKDRHAVTRQAFSVPLAANVDLATLREWNGTGYTVLDVVRHGRKLRPGSHRANAFELRVRRLLGARELIEARLRAIAQHGVPNYFGPQRLGRDGANLERALAWSRDPAAAPRDRTQRGFALSAARSRLFNAVLAERVRRGDWNRPLPGEAVMLDGKRSFFAAPVVEAALLERCLAMDVHPSGPLPGRGAVPATAAALEVEQGALAGHEPTVELLAHEGLEHERRALRLPLRELSWEFEDDATLVVRFTLPRGTFATAVLHELLADAWEAADENDE